MQAVTIYSSMMCPYCHRAKALLKSKGVNYREIDVTFKPAARRDLIQKTGGQTSVPQIWVGEVHVGGCDELHALEQSGKLDPLLKGTTAPSSNRMQ